MLRIATRAVRAAAALCVLSAFPVFSADAQVAPSAHDGFVALDAAQTEHLGLLNRFRTTVPPVLNTEHWTSWPPPPPPPPPPDLDLDRPQDEPHLLPRDVPLGKD